MIKSDNDDAYSKIKSRTKKVLNHPDAKEDKQLIRKMVKKDALNKGMK